MTVPVTAKTPPKSITKPIKSTAKESAETESAFAERMEKLENTRETRREEAVLEKLRSKMKGAGGPKAGMPGGSGVAAGSSYADFIKSRLEDALRVTSSYSTKNPEVVVRLTITAEGKLSRMKIERSSGDAIFEMAVKRAIDMASEKFVAPPNRTVFENGFVFKPKGIASGSSR
jgi:colicin import membrane protein